MRNNLTIKAILIFAFMFNAVKSMAQTYGSEISPGIRFVLENSRGVDLQNYSPNNFQSKLDEIHLALSKNKPFETSLQKLPKESLMFFFILGSFSAIELFTQFEKNPMAGMDHLVHQLSPLGIFSFYNFILMNGVTHTVLDTAIKNPKAKFMIPYLSMTAGFVAQSLTSQLLSSASFQTCIKTITTKYTPKTKDEGSCQDLYDKEVITGKILENAPALTSMLISSLASAYGEKFLYQGIYKMTGVNLYLKLASKTLQVGRMTFSIMNPLQMAAFTALDAYVFQDLVFDKWNRGITANQFHQVNEVLNTSIVSNKSSKWENPKELSNFSIALDKQVATEFRKYRSFNIRKIQESNASWNRFLEGVLKNANMTLAFYSILSEEIANGGSKLDLKYPLAGIKTPQISDDKKSVFLTKPLYAENMQLFHINESSNQLEHLKSEALKNHLLYGDEKKWLESSINKLTSNDKSLIIESLQFINNELKKKMSIKSPYYSYLLKIKDVIGDFNPELEAGFGFLKNIISVQKAENIYKMIPDYIGIFKIKDPSNYLLMSMICGVDLNDKVSLVKYSRGFAAEFNPPKVVIGPKPSICDGRGEYDEIFISTHKFIGPDNIEYKNALDYLRKNFNPDLIGLAQTTQWWETNIQLSFSETFNNFSSKYNYIMRDFLDALKNKENNKNLGPIAEAPLVSLIQEMRIYNLVQGEILKDLYIQQKQIPLFQQNRNLFSSVEDKKIPDYSPSESLLFPNSDKFKNANQKTPNILRALELNFVSNWDVIQTAFGQKLTKDSSFNYSLYIQTEIDYLIQKIIWNISSIQAKEKCYRDNSRSCKIVFNKKIDRELIKSEIKLIESKISEFAQLHSKLSLNLSKAQKDLVDDLKNKQLGIVSEISNFVGMFSTVDPDVLFGENK